MIFALFLIGVLYNLLQKPYLHIPGFLKKNPAASNTVFI